MKRPGSEESPGVGDEIQREQTPRGACPGDPLTPRQITGKVGKPGENWNITAILHSDMIDVIDVIDVIDKTDFFAGISQQFMFENK